MIKLNVTKDLNPKELKNFVEFLMEKAHFLVLEKLTGQMHPLYFTILALYFLK